MNNNIYCSACHEPGHSRRTFSGCRMNPRNLDENVEMSDPVRCSACNEIGHSRRTFRGCRLNPCNQRNLSDGELWEEDVEMSEESNVDSGISNLAKHPNSLPSNRDDRGTMSCVCCHCGAYMWIDERVSTSSKINPQFQLCCGKGQYINHPFSSTPQYIRDLLRNNNQSSKEFKKNIRAYNSALSFTSLGVKLDHSVANRIGGAYTFRIHGNLYHRIGTSLEPNGGESPSFAQIYVYDAANELQNRHAIAQHVSVQTLGHLQDLMHKCNPFVRDFKTMAQLDRETPGGIEDISMIFQSENTPDPRRYNVPTHPTEIGVLIIGNEEGRDGLKPKNRDVVIRLRNKDGAQGALVSINEIHQHYDPMQYVLIFPQGDPGWNIESTNIQSSKKVTIMQYYSFHLMYRPGPNSCDIHLFGALFHQYIVDMYAKMEHQRLNYLRHNQNSLRSDLYNNLQDAANIYDCDMSVLGKKTILPSSFIGSPRHMTQLYQDSMSIVRKFGKPDLFITFTCNPNWPEIQRELLYGQTASDRPDLCSRVFNLKLKSLLNDLKNQEIFGKVVALIYTIEFQKRGLPHAHILLILHVHDKIKERDIDNVISAKIPDQEAQPLLYETITRNMMHGPCGALYPSAPCMKNGKCSKEFPKTFVDTTYVSQEGGYPKYRRPADGKAVHRNGIPLDNRWVVPYNPYLSVKYNAHVNVEICASFVSVKYVYKYVYKGHDRAQVSVEDNDEIQNFIDARFVSASEACWRLFSFSLHDEYPKHQRLSIHLPDEQQVYFNEGDDIHDILSRPKKNTTLTAWFKANSQYEYARQFLYTEFPEKFVWVKKTCTWKLRERNLDSTIGRIYSISPREVEKYCLRMILHHVRGAQSFDDLKTVNGVFHQSFRDAACALNLLEDDEEWIKCLNEACSYKLPSALREMYVVIIVFNAPSNPYNLWYRFCKDLTEDFLQKRRQDLSNPALDYDQYVYDCGLCDIEDRLQEFGFTLASYNGFVLPTADPRRLFDGLLSEEQNNQPRILRDHHLLNARLRSEPLEELSFNSDQQVVFDRVLALIDSHEQGPKIVFVDGPGGTGKTYLFNALLDVVRRNYGIAIGVAASGTASLLMKAGKTAHSTFKIPLSCDRCSICSITPLSAHAELIRQAKLIIWDEASMISRDVLEAVDRTFKEVCKVIDPVLESIPFGGRVVVFGGDFRQVLPVIPKASRGIIVSQCINRSFLWASFQKMQLRINMRVQTTALANSQLALKYQEFANYLLDVGNGDIPSIDKSKKDTIVLRDDMVVPGTNVMNLTSVVFHNFQGSVYQEKGRRFLIDRAILTSLNSTVSTINDVLLNQFEGVMFDLFSADKLCSDDTTDQLRYPMELLNNVDVGSLPPHHLRLKVGCPIMLLRNLNPAKGLCNGTRLFCLSINQRVIVAEIATGSNIGEIVTIPRIKIESQESVVGVHFSRLQFPVRPAFAMTINKSQGQTLDFVGLYLPEPVFSHGQLYVAMSRVKTPDSIRIMIGHKSNALNSTDNVVYKEVFQ